MLRKSKPANRVSTRYLYILLSGLLFASTSAAPGAFMVGCGPGDRDDEPVDRKNPMPAAPPAEQQPDEPTRKNDSAQISRPNIVLFLVDDMGWKDAASLGNPLATISPRA